MRILELKIPPPIVALLTGAVMWLVLPLGPSVDLPPRIRAVTVGTIAICGGAVALAGFIAFRRARTTINPLRPASASTLVTAGIYRFTRNPMYLGLLLVLVAWAVRLSSLLAFAGPFFFVFYMHCFQITPEEKVLAAKFGKDYSDYAAQVRRWL
jgi:protein-S-isoprenylcysteine O-methyltransferase Ste14